MTTKDWGLEFTDRYQALGMPYPDPHTMCRGQCEGIGVVPVHRSETDSEFLRLWQADHDGKGDHDCDGWHFVTCPDCHGTGKRVGT